MFNTSIAKSNKYKSTRSCLFCGGTRFRHNGYQAYPCNQCTVEGTPVKLDIDNLIGFLKYEINNKKEMLDDSSLKLDSEVRKFLENEAVVYDSLLSVILSNSFR